MKLGCALGWGLSAVLAAAFGITGYTVLVGGQVEPHVDGRTAVLLKPDERNRALTEMRALLEAVQTITAAAVEDDMATVTEAASAVGMSAAKGENPQLLAKLPGPFLKLGMDTHRAFDDLAELAGQTDDGRVVLRQMGDVMLNCVSCHDGYRLGIEGQDQGDL